MVGPARQKILKDLLALCYLENRFRVSDPEIHGRCRKIYESLPSDAQAALKEQVEEGRIAGKWKRVKLFNAEDRRALKALLMHVGVVRSWGRRLVEGLIFLIRQTGRLIRKGILKLLDGARLFGKLPARVKLTTLGLTLLAGLLAAVLIDWRMSPLTDDWELNTPSRENWENSPPGRAIVDPNRVYTIQVGAVTSQAKADRFISLLKRNKISGVYVLKVKRKRGGYWYKIRVGSFDSKDEAQQVARRLVRRNLIKNYFLITLKRTKS